MILEPPKFLYIYSCMVVLLTSNSSAHKDHQLERLFLFASPVWCDDVKHLDFLNPMILCGITFLFVQASLKTEREKNKDMYFPLRKYAIKV